MSKRPGDPGYAAGWCIHYGYDRAKGGATCAAGCQPEKFLEKAARDEKGKLILPLIEVQPCFLTETGASKPNAFPCERLRRPTPEEISAHEEWVKGRMDRLRKVMEAIAPWRKANKGKSAAETIACPNCQGRLYLSIAAYNGHVHGKCATPGCVEWRE